MNGLLFHDERARYDWLRNILQPCDTGHTTGCGACPPFSTDQGPSAETSAGLVLEELDEAGNLLATHPKATANEPATFCYVSREITTTAKTSRIRFVLDTTLASDEPGHSVTCDQCQLDGPPAPATVSGRIADEKNRPLAGALVSAGEQSVRTDAEGK